MGLTKSGNQPFELHGNLVVCNGELYGFKEWREQLKHKYTFYSDSDCEIILPLYETYGLDFFKQLDAEFALVIYDAKKKMILLLDEIRLAFDHSFMATLRIVINHVCF